MTTAIPAVNPVVTGWGTNWISLPSPSRPIITRMRPAIAVAANSPTSPNSAVTGINPDTAEMVVVTPQGDGGFAVAGRLRVR